MIKVIRVQVELVAKCYVDVKVDEDREEWSYDIPTVMACDYVQGNLHDPDLGLITTGDTFLRVRSASEATND